MVFGYWPSVPSIISLLFISVNPLSAFIHSFTMISKYNMKTYYVMMNEQKEDTISTWDKILFTACLNGLWIIHGLWCYNWITGNHVYIHGAAATPRALVPALALYGKKAGLKNVRVSIWHKHMTVMSFRYLTIFCHLMIQNRCITSTQRVQENIMSQSIKTSSDPTHYSPGVTVDWQ